MFSSVKTWLSGLSLIGKIIAYTSAAIIGGTVISAFAHSGGPNQPMSQPPVTAQPTKPKIEVKTVTEDTPVPYERSTVEDANLAKGMTQILTAGVNGVKTITYEVTYTDGKQTNKKSVKEEVTTPPVTEVTAVDTYVKQVVTKPASNCDPNYSGACVPIASDVDCAGGSGNGPAYVRGPVYVIGSDIYGLDRDGNGVGCEN